MITHDVLERLAQAIHARYLADQARLGTPMGSNPAMVAWVDLAEDLKLSNRAQAKDIEVKLASIGCSVAALDASITAVDFSEDEVEVLAQYEHERWHANRTALGWTHGSVYDSSTRRHPSLVPWSDLSEAERDKDRRAVRNIAALLADVGLCVVRSA